jgi:hypothetical protein
MGIDDRFWFRFNQFEKEWFEKHPDKNPTSSLHDGMYLLMKKNFVERINRIANIFAFGIIGMILLCFSLVPFIPIWLFMVFIICGVYMVLICLFCFMKEVRPYGRRSG